MKLSVPMLLVTLVLLANGCGIRTIDSSTDESMRSSIQAVRTALPESRRDAFDEALKLILFRKADLRDLLAASVSKELLDATFRSDISGKTGEEIIAFAQTIQAAREAEAAQERAKEEQDKRQHQARLAAIADQARKEFEREREQREAKERAEAFEQLRQLEVRQSKATEALAQCQRFEVLESQLTFQADPGVSRQPVIGLVVRNGTDRTVAKVYFQGTIISPERSVPWFKDTFNFSIPGGLEPGETATWRLEPNMFSSWTKAKAPPGAQLTVSVINLDGPTEKSLFGDPEFSEHDRDLLDQFRDRFKDVPENTGGAALDPTGALSNPGTEAVPTPAPPAPLSISSGLVYLASDPPGAAIWLEGKPTGVLTGQGTLRDVPAGNQHFELRLPLYKPQQLNLEVLPGDLVRPALIRLEPYFGGVKVQGTPAGGTMRMVCLDQPELPLVVVPFGSTVDKITAGRWQAEAVADDHVPRIEQFLVPSDGTFITLSFALEAKRTDVVIESHPSGASVTWDGDLLKGTTPLKLAGVPVGAHRLVLIGADSGKKLIWADDVRIDEGSPFLLERTLTPWTVRVTFESSPTGAKVFGIDLPAEKKYVGRIGDGEVACCLEPGTWAFKFVLAGYLDSIVNVSVNTDSHDQVITTTMAEEQGTIDLTVRPANAAVTLDGVPLSVVQGRARLKARSGSHLVCGSLRDFDTISQTVVVSRDTTIPVQLNLPRTPSVGETWTNSYGMRFSWCPPGEFDMGSPIDEPGRFSNEGPVHRVHLAHGFWLGTFEVTQGEWKAVVGFNPSMANLNDRRPVERVSWDDCQEFAKKLAALDKNGYRLPSEAEWEYACRAGTTSARYDELQAVAWCDDDDFVPQPVGEKLPNSWGLYDMLGNVYEWCQDSFQDNYAGAPNDGSVWDRGGARRTLRGGSRLDSARRARAASRLCKYSHEVLEDRGLRLIAIPRAR